MKIDKGEEAKEFFNVKESWDDDIPVVDYSTKKSGMGFTLKFFFFSLFIFLLAGGFAFYSFTNKSASFSQEKIDFFITAPVSTDSGSDTDIDFSVTNKNSTPISDAYIVVSYDSGESVSGNKNLITQKIEIGEVLPNTSINKSISASLFGNEGDSKEINSTFFYKVAATKAEFNRSGTPIFVLMKSSPVSIVVEGLKEVRQNNNFQLSLTISNNTNNEIKNLLVSVRPPNDFVYASSSFPTYNSNPSWLLPKLIPGQKQIIYFSGKLSGPLGEVDKFSFIAGLPKTSSVKNSTSTLNNFDNYNLSLDNIYTKVEKSISIAGQYLEVSIISDSTSGEDKVSQNDLVFLDLNYKSNLDYPLDNLVLMAKITGNSINEDSIDAGLGVYDPDSNAVIWDKSVMPDLAQIPANGEGKLRLKFKISKDAVSGSKVRLQIYGKGDRVSETGVSNEQNISIDRTWIVN